LNRTPAIVTVFEATSDGKRCASVPKISSSKFDSIIEAATILRIHAMSCSDVDNDLTATRSMASAAIAAAEAAMTKAPK
jgi:hypothetical protein